MKAYKARDYHNAALFPIELDDGTVWRVRIPRVQDIDLMDELQQTQQARFIAYRDALKVKADAAREEAEQAGAEDADTAARALIAAEPDEDPEDISRLYITCEVLAAFITPEVSAREVMQRLGADFGLDAVYEMHQTLMDAMSGDAAKKRVRGR